MQAKRITLFISLLLLTLISAKAQSKGTNSFIGQWWDGIEMGGTTLTISSNNAFYMTDDHMGETVGKGTWAANGNTLTLTFSGGNKMSFTLVNNANITGRNKIALKALGKNPSCDMNKGYCYFKIQ